MTSEKIVVECENCGRLIPTGLMVDENDKWIEDSEAQNTRVCCHCGHLNPSKLDSQLRPMYRRIFFTRPASKGSKLG